MLCKDEGSFWLTDKALQDSPSRADGISEADEAQLRSYGAGLVQEAVILMRLPQAVAATGMTLLQRFYCKQSFKKHAVERLAAAATYLAIKLEEIIPSPGLPASDDPFHFSFRNLVLVFHRLTKRKRPGVQRLTPLEIGGQEYHGIKNAIIKGEQDMLRTFGFIVHCDPPHKLLISMVKVFDEQGEWLQQAWNIANDSLRTTLCVRFKSDVIALGIIFYATRKLQKPMPEEEWWTAFGVQTEQLVAVVKTLHQLYQQPKPGYIDVGRAPRQAAVQAPTPEPSTLLAGIATPVEQGGDMVTVSTACQEGGVQPRAASPHQVESALPAGSNQAGAGAQGIGAAGAVVPGPPEEVTSLKESAGQGSAKERGTGSRGGEGAGRDGRRYRARSPRDRGDLRSVSRSSSSGHSSGRSRSRDRNDRGRGKGERERGRYDRDGREVYPALRDIRSDRERSDRDRSDRDRSDRDRSDRDRDRGRERDRGRPDPRDLRERERGGEPGGGDWDRDGRGGGGGGGGGKGGRREPPPGSRELQREEPRGMRDRERDGRASGSIRAGPSSLKPTAGAGAVPISSSAADPDRRRGTSGPRETERRGDVERRGETERRKEMERRDAAPELPPHLLVSANGSGNKEPPAAPAGQGRRRLDGAAPEDEQAPAANGSAVRLPPPPALPPAPTISVAAQAADDPSAVLPPTEDRMFASEDSEIDDRFPMSDGM